MFFRQADDVLPDVICFIIIQINGSPDLICGHFQMFGDEFPAPLDGLFFEIVTEGEATQHFEEGTMTGSDTYVIDISGTDTLLACGHSLAGGSFQTSEIRLQRSHAGVDDQKALVLIGDQREASSCVMFLGLIEILEHFSQFVQSNVSHVINPPFVMRLRSGKRCARYSRGM